jgi:hypothetical protein
MSWTNTYDRIADTKEEQTSKRDWNTILSEVDSENIPMPELIVQPVEIVAEQLEIEPVQIFEPDTGPEKKSELFKHNSTNFFDFSLYEIEDEDGTVEYSTTWNPSNVNSAGTWREENKNAAKKLIEKYKDSLALFYDGSIRSQVMLLSFNDAGTIPRVYSTSIDNVNSDETLISLHNRFSFPLRIISLSRDFWKRRSLEISLKYKLNDITDIRHIWASTASAGIPIFSNGIPSISMSSTNFLMIDKSEKTVLDTFAKFDNSSIIPAFFRYTPEQIMSFLSFAPNEMLSLKVTNSDENFFNIAKSQYPELINAELDISDLESLLNNSAKFKSYSCVHELRSIDECNKNYNSVPRV